MDLQIGSLVKKIKESTGKFPHCKVISAAELGSEVICAYDVSGDYDIYFDPRRWNVVDIKKWNYYLQQLGDGTMMVGRSSEDIVFQSGVKDLGVLPAYMCKQLGSPIIDFDSALALATHELCPRSNEIWYDKPKLLNFTETPIH